MSQNDADTPPPVAPTADVQQTDDGAAALTKRRRAPRKPPEGEFDAAASFEQADPQPAASFEQADPQLAPSTLLLPAGGPDAVADVGLGDDLRAVSNRAELGAPADGAALGAAPSVVGDAQAPAAVAEPAGGEAPRRSRNRRRGRRGGERGDGLVDANGQAQVRASTMSSDGDVSAEAESDADDDRPADRATGDGADASQPPPRPAPDVGALFAEVLSGAFDVEPAAETVDMVQPLPDKRVLAAEPDAPKLHKVLAQAGVGSRRDMEQMIVDGSITVNGEPAHIGQRISFGDRIAVGGKPVRFRIAPPPPRVLAYHKPAGEVVTHDDPQQRPTVFRRLPRLQNGKWQSVGRLDINTEGLLLFTNSGELANQLMHPRFGVEREYAVRSLGVLGDDAKAKLMEGVDIDGQRCAFKSIVDGGGEGANHWYRCVITEGRNREVRKLFETVGHAVSRLIRIRYGSVVLPRGLKRGVWVDLDDIDVRSLHQITGVQQSERAGDRRGNRRGAANGNQRGRNGAEHSVQAAPRGPRPDNQQQQQPQTPRPDRGPRPDRPPRAERPDRVERGEGGAIPNPLQQTFDKRAIQQERALRRDMPEDGPIPNPLQQTYDKRALQRDRQPQRDMPDDGPIPNPLQQTYDKRFSQQSRGFGPGGSAPAGGNGGGRAGAAEQRGRKKQGNANGGADARQPDPMKTSVGYIGGDAFLRKAGGGGGGPRGGPRNGRGGGSGNGGTGNGGGNPGRNGGGNRGGRSR